MHLFPIHPLARPVALLSALGLTAALALGACGDDGDGSAATTTSPAAPAEDPGRSEEAYCEIEREVDAQFERTFTELGEDASPEEQQAALVALASELLDEVEAARAVVPPSIEEDFEVLAAAVEAAAAGDPSGFDDPAADGARVRIDEVCYADG